MHTREPRLLPRVIEGPNTLLFEFRTRLVVTTLLQLQQPPFLSVSISKEMVSTCVLTPVIYLPKLFNEMFVTLNSQSIEIFECQS